MGNKVVNWDLLNSYFLDLLRNWGNLGDGKIGGTSFKPPPTPIIKAYNYNEKNSQHGRADKYPNQHP